MKINLFIIFFIYSIMGFNGYAQNSVVVIKPTIRVYKTIDSIVLKLHIYKPIKFDASKTYNCVVFFHGGGWNMVAQEPLEDSPCILLLEV
jgi:acetyl esterase